MPGSSPMLRTGSESEAGDQRALARLLVQLADHGVLRETGSGAGRHHVVDDSETAGVITGAVPGRRGERIGGNGVANLRTVEDVDELGADLKIKLFFNPEIPPEVQVLLRTARLPEIGVEKAGYCCRPNRTRTECAVGGVDPGIGIQHLVEVRVDAAAVQILQEKRLSRHSEHLAVADIVGSGGSGGRKRKAAGVLQDRANLPILHQPLGYPIVEKLGARRSVVDTGIEQEWLVCILNRLGGTVRIEDILPGP